MLTTQQIFWSIAIVSSVLLVILLVMTLFTTDEERENGKAAARPWLDPRFTLLFTTLFGWFTVIGFYLEFPTQQNLLLAFCLGFVLAYTPVILKILRKPPTLELGLDLKGTILSTGQVLQPIPPHRNGLGKVQLDHRKAVLEMDAVTTGQEIQPGQPVRVVDIIDNRILVVEPLQDDLPPDGGLVRLQS